MTPDLVAVPTQVVACTLRNAYAYGTMDVVQFELLDGLGRLLRSNPPSKLQPLSALAIDYNITPSDPGPFSCRVTVLETVPGYVRAAIHRLDTTGATVSGFPAQCNPF